MSAIRGENNYIEYIRFLCGYPREWSIGLPRGAVRGSVGLQKMEQALKEQESMSYSRLIEIIDEAEKSVTAEGLLFEIYVIEERDETQCFRKGETFKQIFEKLRNIARQDFSKHHSA